jgi:hypothetical protein
VTVRKGIAWSQLDSPSSSTFSGYELAVNAEYFTMEYPGAGPFWCVFDGGLAGFDC